MNEPTRGRSIDDAVGDCVPVRAGSAYDGVSIRNVLADVVRRPVGRVLQRPGVRQLPAHGRHVAAPP
jgi:hypothetical protein